MKVVTFKKTWQRVTNLLWWSQVYLWSTLDLPHNMHCNLLFQHSRTSTTPSISGPGSSIWTVKLYSVKYVAPFSWIYSLAWLLTSKNGTIVFKIYMSSVVTRIYWTMRPYVLWRMLFHTALSVFYLLHCMLEHYPMSAEKWKMNKILLSSSGYFSCGWWKGVQLESRV